MLPELKIAQLRHFVWVAELKGFHAAAEKAHRTQPAISLSIRDLENKLGESLFEKRNAKTAKTELTPFGHYFLPKAKALITHHDRVAEDMTLLAEHKTGHLRIAAIPSIASRILPELLRDFMKDAPELHVSFYDGNSDAVLNMVERQEVDFAIASLFSLQEHSDKAFTPIWDDRIGVVCLNDHPLAQLESVSWQQLKPYRLISNGTSRLLEDTDAGELIAQAQFHVSNMISLTAMLEAGFGITTLPWYAVPKDTQRLTFVPLSDPEVVRRIGIVRMSNKTLSPPAEALVRHILHSTGTQTAT